MAEMKLGKLGHEKGEYYLEVEGKHTPLPFTLTTDEKTLQQLVGQDVEVFLADAPIVAFRPAKPDLQSVLKHIIILCYKPAEIFKSSRSLSVEDQKKWAEDALKQGLPQDLVQRATQFRAK